MIPAIKLPGKYCKSQNVLFTLQFESSLRTSNYVKPTCKSRKNQKKTHCGLSIATSLVSNKCQRTSQSGTWKVCFSSSARRKLYYVQVSDTLANALVLVYLKQPFYFKQFSIILSKDLWRKDESRSSKHQKVVKASLLTKTFLVGSREG
jgi:hypothetical protein